MTEIAHTIISAFQSNGHIFRILFSSLPTMNQAQREKYMEQVVEYRTGALGSYFASQIKQGTFRADLDPDIAARTFSGMLLPFILMRDVLQVGTRRFDYDRVIAHAVRLFLEGTLSKRPRGKRS